MRGWKVPVKKSKMFDCLYISEKQIMNQFSDRNWQGKHLIDRV